MYTAEQLEILMEVATSEDPVATARQFRTRWAYILAVAQGRLLDAALAHVMYNCQLYTERGRAMVAVLDEWLAEHAPRSA